METLVSPSRWALGTGIDGNTSSIQHSLIHHRLKRASQTHPMDLYMSLTPQHLRAPMGPGRFDSLWPLTKTEGSWPTG